MDFKKFSKYTVEHIDKELKKLLEEWRKEVGKTSRNLLPLVDKFIKACEGGKRLRGTLVVLGYEMTRTVIPDSIGDPSHIDSRLRGNDKGRENDKGKRNDIFKVAAAYEIFHTAILAHDDVIDQSLERRGGPSLYQALGGNHYGISQAVTLADAGFFLAIKIISESKFAEKLKNQALRVFAKTMVDTAVGQMLDIQKGDPATIMRLKTAKYTVSGPLQIGIILAGVSPTSRLLRRSGYEGRARLRRIKEFGESLGIAFQIKDDILDGEVKSVDFAKAQALKYMDQARKIIPRLTQDTTMQRLLNELVDYMVERSK